MPVNSKVTDAPFCPASIVSCGSLLLTVKSMSRCAS